MADNPYGITDSLARRVRPPAGCVHAADHGGADDLIRFRREGERARQERVGDRCVFVPPVGASGYAEQDPGDGPASPPGAGGNR